MAYEVIWTDEAHDDLFSIATYLTEKWSYESAEKFFKNVKERIEKLLAMPSLGRPTSKQNHYMYQLDRKNVLFFIIDGNYLVLLSIYPYKKDISKSNYY